MIFRLASIARCTSSFENGLPAAILILASNSLHLHLPSEFEAMSSSSACRSCSAWLLLEVNTYASFEKMSCSQFGSTEAFPSLSFELSTNNRPPGRQFVHRPLSLLLLLKFTTLRSGHHVVWKSFFLIPSLTFFHIFAVNRSVRGTLKW